MYRHIDMICKCTKHGEIIPKKFRFENEYSETGVVELKVISAKFLGQMKHSGNRTRKFDCIVQDGTITKNCQLMYELDTCIWSLIEIR